MTTTPTLAEALRAGIDLINGDLTGVEWKLACRDFIKQATAAFAAAPQPAPVDRQALMDLIWDAAKDGDKFLESGGPEVIADALLARGLRLPGDETMAWAVVGEDGKIDPRKLWINSRDAEEYCERGERAVRVAIRVVEGGDDAS